MSELLAWYLEELRQMMEGKLSEEKLATILREASSHLTESASRRFSELGEERAAMAAAINAYGAPRKVALAYLRRAPRKVFGLPPVWAALIGVLVAIYAWNFHWLTLSGCFDNFGESWQNVIAGCVCVAGLLLLVLACRAGYRSFRWPVIGAVIGAAGLSVPLLSFWMIASPDAQQGISRFHLARDTERLNDLSAQIDGYERVLRSGIQAYQDINQLAPNSQSPGAEALPTLYRDSAAAAAELGERRFNSAVIHSGRELDKGGQFIVPRMFGSFALLDGRVIVFETMQHFADARAAWAAYGQRDLDQLRAERAKVQGLATLADEARHGRIFFYNPALSGETLVVTLMLLPLFLAVDGLAVVSLRPRRVWPKRRLERYAIK